MLCFIVPVKSKKVSNDWKYFSKLVERTMRSITNQKSSNYQVTVICHELPEFEFKHDKIHFVQVDFPAPILDPHASRDENTEKKEVDKAKKILAGIEHSKKFKPKYIMVVDSDDLISNKIVSFVESQDSNSVGWYINKGYNYKEGANYLFYKNKTFNHLCGSSVIIRADLVNELFRQKPYLFFVHETMGTSQGKFKEVPFPAGVYSTANGENHYMTSGYASKIISRYLFDVRKYLELLGKLSKYRIRFIGKKFKKSFNFYQVK